MKDLKERLKKINSCSDFSSKLPLACENPNIYSHTTGERSSSRALEIVKTIKHFSENLSEQIQESRILFVGMNENIELSKHHLLFIKALKEANIDIVYISNAIVTFDKIEIDREEPRKLNYSFEGIISKENVPNIKIYSTKFSPRKRFCSRFSNEREL